MILPIIHLLHALLLKYCLNSNMANSICQRTSVNEVRSEKAIIAYYIEDGVVKMNIYFLRVIALIK